MPNPFNTQVIDEFRANGGAVGGPFEGSRLILLTTTGARTGARHTTPLGYLPDGDRILVIGSAGGADSHPHWFTNLRADPEVTIEDGVFTYDATALVLEGEERAGAWARAVESDASWADYQEGTARELPVVALVPAPGPPRMEDMPWGQALRRLHDAFRRELATIRREVAESGPRIGAQLRVNCLSVCQGVHHHHTMEDRGMFTAVEQQNPHLSETIARLREEHVVVARLLEELQGVVGDQEADRAQLVASVDRLVEQLEAHLDYEEEQLVEVLDGAAPARG